MDKNIKKIHNELKPRLEKEYKNVWKGDSRMVDYCVGHAKLIYEIGNHLCYFEKFTLNKSFYFGYSDCGQGPSYDEMNKTTTKVSNNLEGYFKHENLAAINSLIKNTTEILENMKNGNSYYKLVFVRKYNNSNIFEISNTKYNWNLNNPNNYDRELTIEEVKKYLMYLNIWREEILKKISTYLKKYGTSKCSIHTYWCDR